MAKKGLGWLGILGLLALVGLLVNITDDKSSNGDKKATPSQTYPSSGKIISPDRVAVLEAQNLLSRKGYDPGPIDGILGSKTRAAIKAFQRDKGLRESGKIDYSLIAALSIPSHAVKKPSIGISRFALQSLFEKKALGFKFEHATAVDGQPRVIGTTPNKLASVELIGPEDNLVQATIMVGIPADDTVTLAKNAVFMAGFIKNAVPEWPEAVTWMNNNMGRALNMGEVETIVGNKQIKLTVIKQLGMALITVKGVSSK